MADYHQLTGAWGSQLYEVNGWQVVELEPHGNGYAEPAGLADALWQVVDDWRPPRMVIDLQRVTFMSSSLMGGLVQVHKRIAMAGGAFHLARLSEHPTEALHACRLHTILPLFGSVEAAAGYSQ